MRYWLRNFRKLYIDPELQVPVIVVLILLVTLESLFVGWGFYKAISITKQWDRPDQTMEFFYVVALTVVPVVIFNFILGIYLSYKIAGPLTRIRKVMKEISRGNLEDTVALEHADLLQSCAIDMNKMVQTLRTLIYRDRNYISEVNVTLNECQNWLSNLHGVKTKERKDLEKLLKEAKSRLSIINMYFTKGKKEK